MVDDPDAIWRPGYDGPPPVVDAVTEPADEPSPEEPDRLGPTRRARSRFALVVVGLAVVGAIVVADRLGSSDDPDPVAAPAAEVGAAPDPSVFGGPEARRLPRGLANLWSIDVDDRGDHWVEVIRRDLVLVALADPAGPPTDAAAVAPTTTLAAFDPPTGEQRWTLRLAGAPRDVAVVGAVDGVLVLEQPGTVGPTVTGVDMATGETRWTTDSAPNAGHVGLVGTPFVARLPSPSDSDPSVHLIDAVSGSDIGAIVSDPAAPGIPGGWSTDRQGTWYVVDDGELVAYDLGSGLGDGVGSGTIIGPVDDVSVLPAVVGDRVAVVDGTGDLAFVAPAGTSAVDVPAGVPSPITSLTPVSDSNLVVTSPGSIGGLSLAGDSVDVAWSRSEGALAAQHPIEGGTLLQVATRGGGAMELVDARTGETVEQLTMTAGALQALVVAGDGYVALRSAQLGTRLAGVGLDGIERWSILGPEPLVVGDRIVVRATSNGGQLRIAAYGDAD